MRGRESEVAAEWSGYRVWRGDRKVLNDYLDGCARLQIYQRPLNHAL